MLRYFVDSHRFDRFFKMKSLVFDNPLVIHYANLYMEHPPLSSYIHYSGETLLSPLVEILVR
jgi:hypothetical protein